jgi:phosphatidate phosphatase
VGALILVIYFVAGPYKRGFFCNDESIMHPYNPNTVTMTMLVSVGISVPVAVVSTRL